MYIVQFLFYNGIEDDIDIHCKSRHLPDWILIAYNRCTVITFLMEPKLELFKWHFALYSNTKHACISKQGIEFVLFMSIWSQ